MSLKTRKTLLLAKREVTYGQDPDLLVGGNVLEALDVSLNPLNAEFVDRGLVRPWFGSKGSVLGDRYSSLDFSVELAGSGTAGTPPAWGKLLRGCGFAEVITPATKVEYNTVSDEFESITLWAYIDGIIHRLRGARGGVSFDFTAGQIPKAKFSFMSLYAQPVDGAFPASPSFTAWKKPLVCNRTNTALSLFGYNANAKSLSLDSGNQVKYRNLFNQEDIAITDRAVVGKTSFEMTKLAEKDWFDIVEAGTTGSLNLVHGLTAGNKVSLNATDMRAINPTYSDEDGVRFLNLDLEFVPNAGSDDITITAF